MQANLVLLLGEEGRGGLMIKIEVVFHFDFKEDEVEHRGQKLLDYICDQFKGAIVEEDFEKNCKIVNIKFIEEEVEAF